MPGMPADNIKRAIRRGTGEEPGVSYEEAQYEAYGPGGAAMIIDVLTDNKNRTVGELRHLLEKHGGNLASTNAVAWMFTKKGYIVVEKAKADEEKLMGAVLDAGADDLQDDEDNWEVFSAPDVFPAVSDAVKQLGVEPATAKVSMIPQNYVKLEGKPAQQMVKLMSRGGLLLRQARDGVELPYVPVRGAVVHGARPPKLPPLGRIRS